MIFPFGVTVTVQRSTRDRFGDATYVDHHTLPGCALRPGASLEDTNNRDTVTIDLTLFAPPGADVRPTDRIVIPGGDAYQVIGQPGQWGPNPFTGWDPGVTVELERVS